MSISSTFYARIFSSFLSLEFGFKRTFVHKICAKNVDEIDRRVVLLTPDKLATAIAIFKEKLPHPDSGAFLVVLVIDLVKFYIGQVTNHQQLSNTTDTESAELQPLVETFGGSESDELLNFPEEDADDFLLVLQNLLTKLESIQVSF